MALVNRKEYLNYEDMSRRLHKTIIRYNGLPYWCTIIAAGGNGVAQLTSLSPGGAAIRDAVDPVKDDAFDVTPIELGYVNTKTHATYIERLPVRSTKQGLSTNHLSMSPMVMHISDLIATVGFTSMVLNQYPTLEHCENEMTKGNNKVVSRAFSKHMRIGMHGGFLTIFISEVPVAYKSNKTDREYLIYSGEQASFFKMMLDEENVPNIMG